MTVETSTLVPMTEANQSFSKVIRLVDEAGPTKYKKKPTIEGSSTVGLNSHVYQIGTTSGISLPVA